MLSTCPGPVRGVHGGPLLGSLQPQDAVYGEEGVAALLRAHTRHISHEAKKDLEAVWGWPVFRGNEPVLSRGCLRTTRLLHPSLCSVSTWMAFEGFRWPHRGAAGQCTGKSVSDSRATAWPRGVIYYHTQNPPKLVISKDKPLLQCPFYFYPPGRKWALLSIPSSASSFPSAGWAALWGSTQLATIISFLGAEV